MKNLIVNFSTGFFRVFREPRDIHRVVMACFLAVFTSHVAYMFESQAIPATVNSEKILFIVLSVIILGFIFSWAIFSSSLNIKLYLRQAVVVGWGVLGHRLFYGVESFGSMFVTAMLFIGWSIWIPFALTGMRFDELQSKVEVWQENKKRGSLKIIRESEDPDIRIYKAN